MLNGNSKALKKTQKQIFSFSNPQPCAAATTTTTTSQPWKIPAGFRKCLRVSSSQYENYKSFICSGEVLQLIEKLCSSFRGMATRLEVMQSGKMYNFP